MKRACLASLLALMGCASRGQLKIIAFVPPPRPAAMPDDAIQAQPTPAAAEAEVLPGDSFWRIARRELGSGSRYAELAAFNGLQANSIIRPGEMLRMPSRGPSQAAAAKGAHPGRALRAPGKGHPAPEAFIKRENHAYAVGEKLTFAVQYFNATAGYAVLSIPEYSVQQGRVCMHVVAEAKTHPFFETFFKVRDRIETFIDADSLIPWRYEKHLREGGFSADAFYLFDQRTHHMLEPDKNHDVTVSAETQDVLSCFFWFRTMELTPGKDMVIHVAADNMQSYELVVNVLRRERVSTLAGDFDCILVQPHLMYDGLFQQKGEVFVWITDDNRRIPVKIQTKIAIGSINITLQDAEWVQPN
jgi:hypothetical protein